MRRLSPDTTRTFGGSLKNGGLEFHADHRDGVARDDQSVACARVRE